ncbi:hypothetical protein CRUP_002591 [Coryphaenoides rupestris]|nr:hypothetical protein CRUP_002591 [Coryphaenoides rupestris]
MASDGSSSIPDTRQQQQIAQQRLRIIAGHLQKSPDNDGGDSVKALECSAPDHQPSGATAKTVPRRRQEVMKWNGWGYSDSRFHFNKKGQAEFTGKRYRLSGMIMPSLKDWFEDTFGASVQHKNFASPVLNPSAVKPPILNEAFVEDLKSTSVPFSTDAEDRGKVGRVPDMVVWPNCHNDVVKLVELACKHNVCVIPYGGGTSVSSALECPLEETRSIVSLDTSQMNRILWLDEKNLTAHVEAGCLWVQQGVLWVQQGVLWVQQLLWMLVWVGCPSLWLL